MVIKFFSWFFTITYLNQQNTNREKLEPHMSGDRNTYMRTPYIIILPDPLAAKSHQTLKPTNLLNPRPALVK